jgi:hypothetical protein
VQPLGNGEPSASVAPLGTGLSVDVNVEEGGPVGALLVVDVHPATRAPATIISTSRARMSSTLHPEPRAAAKAVTARDR